MFVGSARYELLRIGGQNGRPMVGTSNSTSDPVRHHGNRHVISVSSLLPQNQKIMIVSTDR
jgi:hypothetical protein